MKKIVLLMMVLVLFLSGCDNLKTPGEAIKPPKNIANAALQDGNVPLWTIQSNGERFFDTTFISEDEIVTLVYKDGNIYLRSYDKDKMIEEKLLGTKADYRILNASLNKFVVKKGETEIALYDDKLTEILNYNVEAKKIDYQKNVLDAMVSPDGEAVVISNVYYKDNYPADGELILFNQNKIVKKINHVIPKLENFSDNSEKFLFIDLSNRNNNNNLMKEKENDVLYLSSSDLLQYNIYVYNRNGKMIKRIKMPLSPSKVEGTSGMTKISALLSADGNTILFSSYFDKKLYIEKLNGDKTEIPTIAERFYTNKDATKFVIGNYGVSKIYDSCGKLVDYIVVNYGLINDVRFEGNNTYFAINGTTIPNAKTKDYIGVMDESGNMIWTAKVYDTIAMLKFSPDGKRIMAQSSKSISVYDYHNGKIDIIPRPINGKYPEFVWKRLLNEDIEGENAFIFTDELENIYIAKNTNLIKATKNGNQLWMVGTSKPIEFLDLSRNGELIALVIEDEKGSEVIVYDKSGMVISHKYIIKGHEVTSVSVSPDGEYFSYAVSTPENEEYGSFIDFFNDKGYMIWEQKIKSTFVYDLSINKDIVTASFDDGNSSGILAMDFSGKVFYNKDMKSNEPFITASEDGKAFLLLGFDGSIGFYNREKALLSENYTKKGVIQQALMSKDGKAAVLISFSKDYKEYYITFFNNFNMTKTITSSWKVKKAVMTPDGNYIVILSQEYDNTINNANKITMYDKQGNTLYSYYHKSGIYDIAITEDGSNLYIYSADGYVYKYRNK
ncbi:hypothetical protein TthWC1_0896 [Thermoanaerobacter thermohydrosulfuricus WC1]|uniref:Cyclic nucleotide-binding domain-containing protein n=1 Tax=Thermoanaerobacter thermohydrosulfuricus WC1 TaxID=1198630 RepID=M8CYP7_THETY|nr:WD40 repeat domain-containing protein [Thermoanaerobacter thermohydrosulfuricus]EMT39499.1 hypothetical protein TthWC1_0896 [Thermoanaerobacter thermohydrosulfuricus WC1]